MKSFDLEAVTLEAKGDWFGQEMAVKRNYRLREEETLFYFKTF